MGLVKRGKSVQFFLFLVLVVGVVAYALFDFFSEKKAGEIKSEKSIILNWKPEQIDRLEWVEGPQRMKLVRSQEGWQFEQPIQEKADSEAVSTFNEGLVLEKASSVVQESGEIDWKIFGLDSPKAKMRVHNNAGDEVEFSISEKKNFQGETYFRIGTENRVLLVSSTWQQKGEKRTLDFRDRRWARLSAADINEIVLVQGKPQVKLEKGNSDWTVSGAAKTEVKLKLDQNKIRKILSDLTSNQVIGFDFEADSKPMLSLRLKTKDEKTWTGEFGVNKDKRHFLTVKELGMTMELSAQTVDEIYRLSLDYFRDRSEPFQVRRDDVKKIDINLGAKRWSMKLIPENGKSRWIIQPGSAGTYLDEVRLNTLLGQVSALQVAEFLEKPATGASGSESLMTLSAGDGSVILRLELQGPQGKKTNGIEKSVYFAKSNLVSYHFTMEESQWTNLDWLSVLTEKVKDQPKEQNKGSDNK